MMRVVAGGLCLLMITPVMAQSVAEKSGVKSIIGISPSTQDFVTEAAQSDMSRSNGPNMALGSADAPTKSFAQTMITDHTKTSTD